MTSTTAQVNRFAGPCVVCGARVQAGQGTWDRTTGCCHNTGECKTTTKTYQQNLAAERMRTLRADVAAIYTDAGYRYDSSHRIEHADVITGNGLLAYVGGYGTGQVMPYGVRVHRVLGIGAVVSDPIHECPVPSFQTADYFADHLAKARAIVALLDSFKL